MLQEFPVEKGRRFSTNYYAYPWVEYSVVNDAIFCFACRHFASKYARPGEQLNNRAFIEKGFRKWKDAGALLRQHAESERHLSAVNSWSTYKRTKENPSGSVCCLLNKNYTKEVEENRHHVKLLLEATSYLGRQGLSFRGHNEGEESDNRGNFKELLFSFSKFDSTLKEKLSHRYGNYCSAEYQNDLITVFQNRIQQNIVEEVKAAVYFAVMADETKDLSRKEQLAILVRYFDQKTCLIKERAIGIFHMENVGAESLSNKITEHLISLGLNPTLCVGQCYDGASVMSGRMSGVQARFLKHAPYATYIHCRAHLLNLALVNTIKDIPEVHEFFGITQKLYDFISNSNTRQQLFVSAQKELNQEVLTLERTVVTRWFYWYKAVTKIKKRFEAIIIVLETTAELHKDYDSSGLLIHLKAPMFIFHLNILEYLLGITYNLSQQLQSKELDLSKISGLIQGTRAELIETRTDDKFREITEATKKFASSHKLTFLNTVDKKDKTTRIRKISQLLIQNFITDSTLGQREAPNGDSDLKRKYFEIIDKLIFEFDRRLTNNNDLLESVVIFDMNSSHFLDETKMTPFVKVYGPLVDTDLLSTQLGLARKYLASLTPRPASVVDILKELNHLPVAYSEVIKLFRIFLTIPVTTVENERFFSVLKIVKTFLRTTMGDDRMCGLMLMASEKALVKSLDLNQLVNDFVSMRPRRYPLC